MEDKFVSEKRVKELTERSLPTLRNDRSKGIGIPYYKLGRSVRYKLSDVIEWMERHKVQTT